MAVDVEPIDIRVQALVYDIFTTPEIRDIELTDPRFRWVPKVLWTGITTHLTLGDLIDAVLEDQSISRTILTASLSDLKLYLDEQLELTLEDELFSIVSPLSRDISKMPGLLARLGWHGGEAITLQAAAEQVGVTRERVRQIQGKLEQQLLRQATWTPVLDRALKIVTSRLPMHEERMGELLRKTGMTTSETFSAEGLLKAAALFHRPVPFAVRPERGTMWLVSPSDGNQLAYLLHLSVAAQKAVSRYGIVSTAWLISQVREDVPDLMQDIDDAALLVSLKAFDHITVIEDLWIVHPDLTVRNPLVNRLNKLLSVWNPIPFEWAVRQLERDRRDRRELRIDESSLRAFVRFRPEYDILNESIQMQDPPDPNNVMSDSERALRHQILLDGGVSSFADLCDAAEDIGITRITTAVTLKYSPVFFKLVTDEHRTVGPNVDPSEISLDDLLEDEDDEPGADAYALTSDDIDELLDEGSVQERTDSGCSDQVHVVRSVLSVSERDAGRIRKTIKSLLKQEGISALERVTSQHNALYRAVSPGAVREVIKACDDFILVGDHWVTSAPDVAPNPISDMLRKMLVWLPVLPLDVALRQLQRARGIGLRLTTEQLSAFIDVNAEFSLNGNSIVWRSPLPIGEVLTSDELMISSLLSESSHPLGTGAIQSRLDGIAGDSASLQDFLMTSEIIEEIGRHRYTLFAPDHRALLAQENVSPVDDVADLFEGGEPAVVSGHSAAHVETTLPEGMELKSDPERGSVEATQGDDQILEERVLEHADPVTLQPSTTGSMQTMMTSLLDLVNMTRSGRLQLPEIQREYIWKPAQVIKLVDSMYRNYPIGSMLIWNTDQALVARPMGERQSGVSSSAVSFLLDGQQRLTSFLRLLDDNNPDIRFNPFTEEFRIASVTMKTQKHWLSVHGLLTRSTSAILRESSLVLHKDIEEIERRVDRLHRVLSFPVPVNQLNGFSYEEVSEIFVRVNSQGTRLKTAELAVANLAFQLPGLVSRDISDLHEALSSRGWDIPTLFILRMMNGVATGQSRFAMLAKTDRETVSEAWPRTAEALPAVLEIISRNLGIESSTWLPTLNALVVPVSWRAKEDFDTVDERVVMDWFIRASVFGRYTGPIETNLNQDLRSLRDARQPFVQMTNVLRSSVGSFRVTQGDLQGANWQSAWSMLFWLTLRRLRSVDLWTGAILGSSHLGGRMELVRQQVFTRKHTSPGFTSSMSNELANLLLLAQPPEETGEALLPENVFPNVPGDWLTRQCIPVDPELWKLSAARAFVEARRRLLVREMSETLNAASSGTLVQEQGNSTQMTSVSG